MKTNHNSKSSYYHVYTKGLEKDTIFREMADYIVGMNYVASVHYKSALAILAFVLMSNHFHFVVYGRKTDVYHFIDLYKGLISRYIRNKYGDRKLLRRVKTGIARIDDSDARLVEIIAYVLNNPVKAGVNIIPQCYQWGTGNCYFSNIDINSICTPLGQFNRRRQISLLRSNVKLPDNYLINSYGFVEPCCFVDSKQVERLFGRARNMEYHLSVSSKRFRDDSQIVFSDSILLIALKELLEKKYDSMSVSELEDDSLKSVLKLLKRQFNCPPKQLARLCGVSLSRVHALLE